MQSFDFNSFVNSLLDLFGRPKIIPQSSIFILFVALVSAVFSAWISRRFIDLKKLKLNTRKTKEFQKMQRKALRSQDPILKKKVDNQKSTSTKMQSELMKMRMKPMLFTFVQLILIFIALAAYYGNTGAAPDSVVANVPFDLPETIIFNFGTNCNYQRAQIINHYNLTSYGITNSTSLKDLKNVNATIYNSLSNTKKLCVDNPSYHYIPSYIGWYIAINVIINSIVTKVTGLNPD